MSTQLTCRKLAIIGTGPSALYLLRELVALGTSNTNGMPRITFFEKSKNAGCGMPYDPETCDELHLSNIASNEIPDLPQSLTEWLGSLPDETLTKMQISRSDISVSAIYNRVLLGKYFISQYQALIQKAKQLGYNITELTQTRIVDAEWSSGSHPIHLIDDSGQSHTADYLVIASGHQWPVDADIPERGFYTCPWPVSKLMPKEGQFYNHEIGLLGASLSAFDTVISLASCHGDFIDEKSEITYYAREEAAGFHLVVHSAEGWLPHLQYEQLHPKREVYRHVSREKLLDLCDEEGFLRLEDFFDSVCRPKLLEAAINDEHAALIKLLADSSKNLANFVELLTREHNYEDAFEGLKTELSEAMGSLKRDKPTYWKETLDDLIYCLNFHAEYLPAEDHLTLRSTLMPFLTSVIAAMPLRSAKMLLALKNSGHISLRSGLVTVCDMARKPNVTTVEINNGSDSYTVDYQIFVDCSGQSPIQAPTYPYPSLVRNGVAVPARARCIGTFDKDTMDRNRYSKEGNSGYYEIGGIQIDQNNILINTKGVAISQIYDMAFPHTTGVRPYSYGLQACAQTAEFVAAALLREI